MRQICRTLLAPFALLLLCMLAGCGVHAAGRSASNEVLVERVAALETEVATLKVAAATPGSLAKIAPTSTREPTATMTATPALMTATPGSRR